MKSCASDLSHNKKQERGGEDLSKSVQYFLPSPSGVYGCVSGTIFGSGQIWCSKLAVSVGRANNQSIYLDVYEQTLSLCTCIMSLTYQ